MIATPYKTQHILASSPPALLCYPPRAGQTPFLDTEGHSEFPPPNALAPWKLLEPDHHEAMFSTFKMTDLRGHLLFQSRRRCAKGFSSTLTWWSTSFMNPKVDSPLSANSLYLENHQHHHHPNSKRIHSLCKC